MMLLSLSSLTVVKLMNSNSGSPKVPHAGAEQKGFEDGKVLMIVQAIVFTTIIAFDCSQIVELQY
jgi:hypothetical protein